MRWQGLRWLAVALTLAAAAAVWAATGDDIVHLRNGDRITGRTVSETRRTFTVQTPFGRLAIPRSRIHKVVRASGKEDVFNPLPAAPAPAAVATPTPKPARLVLIITGHTFWQAWDPKEKADPRLRLEVSVDEEVAASYVDTKEDPGEIKGATVNFFSFAPDETAVDSGEGMKALLPEARPGRISLKIDAPANPPGERRLRLAYQVNAGPADDPAWKDVTTAATSIFLQAGEATFLQVRQDRGRMEFSGFGKKKMKLAETFKLEVAPE